MSRLGSYKNTAFSESQRFLVFDASTSTASLVLGSELVAYITPQIGSVKAESTRLSTENTDYKVGEIIQTSGATVVGSLASIYLVVPGGSGDFPMLNGNDLLVISGDDTLREQLISQTAGQGASRVSMEGGPTVEVAVNNRVIRVTPQAFGAVGDGTTDDTVALQAFFDYITANKYVNVYCDGNFGISSTVIIGNTALSSNLIKTRYIAGSPSFIALNDFGSSQMVWFKNTAFLHWGGQIKVTGTGGSDFSTRGCDVGIKVGGVGTSASRMKIGGTECRAFAQVGLWSADWTFYNDYGIVSNTFVGAGSPFATNNPSATISGKTDTGTASSGGQRTVIDVDILPITDSATPVLAVIDGEVYQVRDIDSGATQISVFPWVDSTSVSTAIAYVYGAGLYINSSNSAGVTCSAVDSLVCGVGTWFDVLYGPVLNMVTTESSFAGLCISSEPAQACIGYSVIGFYNENNTFDILKHNNGISNVHDGGVIMSTYETEFSKIASTAAPRLADNSRQISRASLSDLTIIGAGSVNEYLTIGSNIAEAAGTISKSFTEKPKHLVLLRDSLTVNITEPDLALNLLYGYGYDTITLQSSGNVNSCPSGPVTFNPPAGYTVNGAASTVFSDFCYAPTFSVNLDVENTNFIISCSSSVLVAKSNSITGFSVSANSRSAVSDFSITGAAFGDFVQLSYSANLIFVELFGKVISSGTVRVYFRNFEGTTQSVPTGFIYVKIIKNTNP
jgi:hypothetical protein